jgi:isocitrate dehydrogenase kinase/phosphatase
MMILDFLKMCGNSVRSLFTIADTLEELKKMADDSVKHSKAAHDEIQALFNLVKRMDEYGTKGSQDQYSRICIQMDKIKDSLNETKIDVARIQGILKSNGISHKTEDFTPNGKSLPPS